jgi:hypothetical protein
LPKHALLDGLEITLERRRPWQLPAGHDLAISGLEFTGLSLTVNRQGGLDLFWLGRQTGMSMGHLRRSDGGPLTPDQGSLI